MHRLLGALKRIMEPPATKRRQIMWRSTPVQQKAKPTPPPPEPTDEEMQYLTFFTDYCKQKNFSAFRSQFPDDFDLTFETKRPDTLEASPEGENTEEST
ncbi:hypothetical protein KM043_011954 [Ampulex compressa]|nr:hypothetical protein KM043_011954 [Ampulex compressa]